MKQIDIPAIRGNMGNHVYYTSTFTFQQIADLVKPVDKELHTSNSLRDQIQRSLTNNYESIKNYILSQKEHFFNALVLAVYDGDPSWNELEIDFKGVDYYSMGFLRLNGEEKIFPVDGQHRVEGIKKALTTNPNLASETITVILIGHHNDKEGMEKTRRIFSTLNRYAKPVSLGDTIALDEDDTVAITIRDLLEKYPLFMNKNIDVGKKNSKALAENDFHSFTALLTLYETNRIIYTYYKSILDNKKRIYTSKNIDDFLKFRPEQEEINEFYEYLTGFWNMFTESFEGVNDYIKLSRDCEGAAKTFRNKETGGLLYFRPVALPQLVKAIFEIHYRLQIPLDECIAKISKTEMCISKKPWNNVLWETKTKTMITKYGRLVFLLIIYMFDAKVLTNKELDTLVKNYAKANDLEEGIAKSLLNL